VYVCVCVCVCLIVWVIKPKKLGGLSTSWAVVSQQNNPATKYSLTPNLTHWVLSKAIVISIEFCSNKNAIILSA